MLESNNSGHRHVNLENVNDTIRITAPTDEREFFTLPQLAAWLGLKPRSIYWMNHVGEGPPRHRIAGKVLYRKCDVEQWLKDRRIVPH